MRAQMSFVDLWARTVERKAQAALARSQAPRADPLAEAVLSRARALAKERETIGTLEYNKAMSTASAPLDESLGSVDSEPAQV